MFQIYRFILNRCKTMTNNNTAYYSASDSLDDANP